MPRVNITIPDGLLDEIDHTASSIGQTRSGFLQEASVRYAAQIRDERERAERAERLTEARRKMRSIAHAVGAPDAAKVIREVREAPPRWLDSDADGS